ncbi:MAG: methyltransferase domain-containing protein [Acetobacteraceae bacterium]
MNRPDARDGGAAAPGLLRVASGTAADIEVPAAVDRHQAYFDAAPADRGLDHATVVSGYYDLVTDFYEYGWGQSFHFAPRARGETFRESMLRHEQFLALRLRLSPASQVLDVGCGVGGPMRTIARFAGCTVTGVNNNPYQVARARQHNRRAALDHRCEVVEGDFMAMPFPDASFDAAYAIEATVHAASLADVYAEVGRVLRPGGLFASYEWALTDRFDPTDPDHLRLRHDIEFTNAIGHLSTAQEIVDAVGRSGLELVQVEDRCAGSEIPWWERLAPTRNPLALRRTSGLGRLATGVTTRLLEAVRIAPRGTVTIARMLERNGRALVAGGMQGIFTPDLLVVMRKRPG